MVSATIVKEFTFDAAHRLEGHDDVCQNLHGHTYRLQVAVYGEIKAAPGAADDGMVIDFGRLSALVKREVVERLDHQYINEVLPFRPTSENLAAWIVRVLRDAGLPLQFVRLYETPSSYVEIQERDVPLGFAISCQ
ncbi:MAG: 6-carboxytetrahydropterin synthase QueD [Peptococcaceae bacterium]|jgi:6-pyruvoyltetrahydropterin/6-carboxytetrahydropterin synthase|nr:6-carboxytetrahydropterin synthase QueD [Peptococcaceae bacterium]